MGSQLDIFWHSLIIHPVLVLGAIHPICGVGCRVPGRVQAISRIITIQTGGHAGYSMHHYGDTTAEWQIWEKRKRNAEIYRRYLAGEDSVELGRAFGLSDRRIRDIIEHERKRRGQ